MKPTRLTEFYSRLRQGNIIYVQEFVLEPGTQFKYNVGKARLYRVIEKTYFTARTLVVEQWPEGNKDEYLDDHGPERRFYILGHWPNDSYKNIPDAESVANAVEGRTINAVDLNRRMVLQ